MGMDKKKKIVLDLAGVEDRASLHGLLKRKLTLGEHYGANLDALWDCLSELGPLQIEIHLRHAAVLRASLGNYAEAFLKLLADAEGVFEYISVICDDGGPGKL